METHRKSYELKDHLGNVRAVVGGIKDTNRNAIVLSASGYFPFGFEMQSFSSGEDYRYGFNGMEKSPEIDPNSYTAEHWQYDSRLGRRWNLDPVDQISISNYATFKNNPVFLIDPLGDKADPSIDVTRNKDGTYKVAGGKQDGDKNIYVVNDQGERTGEVIGEALTDFSFFDAEGNPVVGATIDPDDQSGNEFMGQFQIRLPGLPEYMLNATGGQKYDFKTQTEDGGIKRTATFTNRGMPTNLRTSDKPVFGTARDIGNAAAGYVAGRHGLSWDATRTGFDGLQSYQEGEWATEAAVSQEAQKIGFSIGQERRMQKIIERAKTPLPIGPKW